MRIHVTCNGNALRSSKPIRDLRNNGINEWWVEPSNKIPLHESSNYSTEVEMHLPERFEMQYVHEHVQKHD